MKGFDPIRASAKSHRWQSHLYSKSFHKSHALDELVKGKVSANSGDEAGNLSPIGSCDTCEVHQEVHQSAPQHSDIM